MKIKAIAKNAAVILISGCIWIVALAFMLYKEIHRDTIRLRIWIGLLIGGILFQIFFF